MDSAIRGAELRLQSIDLENNRFTIHNQCCLQTKPSQKASSFFEIIPA
jgi:hypothetical protein